MPGLAGDIAGSGDLGTAPFGLADCTRLPLEPGRGQSIFGVAGLALSGIPAVKWTVCCMGFIAPVLIPLPGACIWAITGDRALSASLSALTGSGEGI